MKAHQQAHSELRSLLSDGHSPLEHAFVALLARVTMDDPARIREGWNRLERELRSHMLFEEECILPRFELENAPEAARIRTEHHEIRAQLDELGIDLDLHALPPARVAQFIRMLREHAAREESALYPWAESREALPSEPALIDRLRIAMGGV